MLLRQLREIRLIVFSDDVTEKHRLYLRERRALARTRPERGDWGASVPKETLPHPLPSHSGMRLGHRSPFCRATDATGAVPLAVPGDGGPCRSASGLAGTVLGCGGHRAFHSR